jgi:sulfonate transport system permease protein
MSHALWSIGRLVVGFALGVSLALTIGATVGLSTVAERLISPTIQLLAPIPIIAWIPLIILLLKIGEAPKVAIIAVGTFFVVFASTVQGIRGVDAKLVEVARVYGKPASVLVRKVLLPAATPSIMTGLHVALGLSWILLLVAEQIATSKGIGWFMWDARTFGRSKDLIVAMICVGVLGKLSDLLLTKVERRMLRWRRAFEGQ